MNNIRSVPTNRDIPLRWMTRLLSLVINSVFLLILCLAVTNEDKPQGPAITVLVLLGLTMAGASPRGDGKRPVELLSSSVHWAQVLRLIQRR